MIKGWGDESRRVFVRTEYYNFVCKMNRFKKKYICFF